MKRKVMEYTPTIILLYAVQYLNFINIFEVNKKNTISLILLHPVNEKKLNAVSKELKTESKLKSP